jgi:hypothetical protein
MATPASFKRNRRNSRRSIQRSAQKQRIVEPAEISLSVSAAAKYRVSHHRSSKIKTKRDRFYQLALVTPGIRPAQANSRKVRRDIWNSRM